MDEVAHHRVEGAERNPADGSEGNQAHELTTAKVGLPRAPPPRVIGAGWMSSDEVPWVVGDDADYLPSENRQPAPH